MGVIVGIDYGRKKIGLAIGDMDSGFAEPFKVFGVESLEEALEKVVQVVKVEKAERVVLGISEGKMAKETEAFGKALRDKFKIPVSFQDETMTTHDAQELSLEAGIKRKKRKKMEDAYSATLILQNYLDFGR